VKARPVACVLRKAISPSGGRSDIESFTTLKSPLIGVSGGPRHSVTTAQAQTGGTHRQPMVDARRGTLEAIVNASRVRRRERGLEILTRPVLNFAGNMPL
jgi:hypothetical protein